MNNWMNEWIIYHIERMWHSQAQGIAVTAAWSEKWKCWSLSHVQLFVTPWTVARQAPLSMGILQARILEWVCHALPQAQGSNPGLSHCRWIPYHLSPRGSPYISLFDTKFAYVHFCFPFWLVTASGQLASIIQHVMFHRHQKPRLPGL